MSLDTEGLGVSALLIGSYSVRILVESGIGSCVFFVASAFVAGSASRGLAPFLLPSSAQLLNGNFQMGGHADGLAYSFVATAA